MDAAAGTAAATASAIPAAVISRNGVRIASRAPWGGYTRISGTTSQLTEVGDTMPGQPIYDTVVPFFSSSFTSLTDITVVGGRSFSVDVTAPADMPSLIGATLSAQMRETPNGRLLAQFHGEVLSATTARFTLNAKQTQEACAVGLSRAVWDAEALISSLEYTLVPNSRVTLVQGVTHVNGSYPDDSARSDGRAYDASVVVS